MEPVLLAAAQHTVKLQNKGSNRLFVGLYTEELIFGRKFALLTSHTL